MGELEAAMFVDRREKKALNGLRRGGGGAHRTRAEKDFGPRKDKSGERRRAAGGEKKRD